jgi:hypothetical protein
VTVMVDILFCLWNISMSHSLKLAFNVVRLSDFREGEKLLCLRKV